MSTKRKPPNHITDVLIGKRVGSPFGAGNRWYVVLWWSWTQVSDPWPRIIICWESYLKSNGFHQKRIQRWGHGRDGFVGWNFLQWVLEMNLKVGIDISCFHYVKKSVKKCWSLTGKKISNNKTHISYEYKIWINNIFNSYPFWGTNILSPLYKGMFWVDDFRQGLSWVESLQLHVVSHKLRCENWEVVSRVEVRDGIVSYITCMRRLIYIDWLRLI